MYDIITVIEVLVAPSNKECEACLKMVEVL